MPNYKLDDTKWLYYAGVTPTSYLGALCVQQIYISYSNTVFAQENKKIIYNQIFIVIEYFSDRLQNNWASIHPTSPSDLVNNFTHPHLQRNLLSHTISYIIKYIIRPPKKEILNSLKTLKWYVANMFKIFVEICNFDECLIASPYNNTTTGRQF